MFWEFIQNGWFEITALAAIVGAVWKFSKTIHTYTSESTKKFEKLSDKLDDQKKDFDHRLDEQREDLHEKIEEIRTEFSISHGELLREVQDIERRREEGTERTRLLMDGVEATLITLHEEGANGPVTSSLQAIQAYKSKKAAED